MKKLITSLSFFLVGYFSLGQTSINTTGGSVSNTSGAISYSIGQTVYQSSSNSSGSVNQGVQQAFDISVVSMEESTFNFSLQAYPNPTKEVLNLQVGNYKQEKLAYKLIDLEGKVISEARLQSEVTSFDMQKFPPTTYFLEILQEGKKVQSFKIIKNQ
jgi:hypothetical protein